VSEKKLVTITQTTSGTVKAKIPPVWEKKSQPGLPGHKLKFRCVLNTSSPYISSGLG